MHSGRDSVDSVELVVQDVVHLTRRRVLNLSISCVMIGFLDVFQRVVSFELPKFLQFFTLIIVLYGLIEICQAKVILFIG